MQKNKKNSKNSFIKKVIIEHIKNNLKEYLIVTVFFLIGIISGIILVNNTTQEQSNEISSYLTNFLIELKNNYTIDRLELLKQSVLENTRLSIILWFVGSTVVGIPIVYAIISFRGFCLGYAIASSVATMGTKNAIIFDISTMLFQNILFIPAILALGVSGIKLYKSIVKDKRRENIKVEIYRHTIFSMVMTIILIISSLIEVYISSYLLVSFVKYI